MGGGRAVQPSCGTGRVAPDRTWGGRRGRRLERIETFPRGGLRGSRKPRRSGGWDWVARPGGAGCGRGRQQARKRRRLKACLMISGTLESAWGKQRGGGSKGGGLKGMSRGTEVDVADMDRAPGRG